MDPVTVGSPGSGSDPHVQAELGRRRFVRLLLGFSLVSTVSMIITPIVGFLIP